MKILVACEESQAITIELRKLRHEAYSCDTETCSGNHPEWHLQQDVTPLLKMRWDMIIAHPPCTYMSNAGACRMYPQKGHIDAQRLYKAIKAKEFFMQFYNANCDKIAIENPMPLKIIGLPQETQRIQPYQFGEPWSKKTYLWLKGLQPLEPTDIMDNYKPFVPSKTGRKLGGASYGAKNCAHNSRDRSKTFHGIALAMALQWAGTANELKG